MAKSRVFNTGPQAPRQRHPQTAGGWTALIDRAIERAVEKGDRRLTGLQKAKADGRSEAHLRAMGIICEADLLREFPEPTGSG
jgi:hypothetical protein